MGVRSGLIHIKGFPSIIFRHNVKTCVRNHMYEKRLCPVPFHKNNTCRGITRVRSGRHPFFALNTFLGEFCGMFQAWGYHLNL
jgi:hypothetical protein